MTRVLGAVRLRRLAAAVLTVAAVASCSALGESDSGDTGGNAQVERAKVKIGIINQLIDVAGFERAQRAGYFKAEGLEIEVVPIKSATDAVPQLATDQLQFAFGNWTTFVEAQFKKTVDLRVVSDGYQSKEGMSALVAMPDSGIKGPKDLQGKTIGINAQRGNVHLSVLAIMQANDVPVDPNQFTVIPTSGALEALQTKKVPVMSLQEPNLTTAKQKLGVVVVADRATGPVADFPIAGYVSSAGFTQGNPKTVAAFQRAMSKGQADVSDRQIMEETLLAYAGIDENIAKTVVAGVFPTSVDQVRLQRVADLMQTYSILPEKFDVGPMIYRAPAS